jgi:hypothetical protein
VPTYVPVLTTRNLLINPDADCSGWINPAPYPSYLF